MFHRRHVRTVIGVTLALAAAAPSAASAHPFGPIAPQASSQTQAPPAVNPYARDAANPAVRAIAAQAARVTRALAARDALTGTASSSPPSAKIVTVFQPSGFDWGDAGIGAAGGLALSMLGVGGALVISSQRRASRHNIPAAPTS